MVSVSVNGAFKPGVTVDREFRELAATVTTSKGLRAETPTPGTLAIVHRRTPTWAKWLGWVGVLVAIVGLVAAPALLVFLLLLVFRLAKREDRVTIIGVDSDGGSTFSVHGRAVPQLAGFLRREFPAT